MLVPQIQAKHPCLVDEEEAVEYCSVSLGFGKESKTSKPVE